MKVQNYTFHDDRLTIGILSDSHGVTDPAVIDVIAQCDLAIHAGDIMDESVLTDIHNHTRLLAVAGNNDRHLRWSADSKEVDEPLPDIIRITLPSGTIAVEHGHRHGHVQPEHRKLIAAHPDARAIIYGHTHKQLIDQAQTPWILNPGAAGHIRNHGGPKCMVLHVDAEQWRAIPHNFQVECPEAVPALC